MAKKVVGIVKVRIPGGEATPAPPLHWVRSRYK